ncbi:DUF551 domain-containing protein [Acinetobacter johnsonii]|uniref:DUF551 domain-containing protein n=1 Tax=Acinetobacter johnsonii TaxID=40214 RepID=UPI003AF6C60B
MDIKKLKVEFEKLKYINEKLEYLNFDEHLGCYVEKNNGMPVGLAAWVNGAFYGFKQAAKAQAVPRWISTSDRMPKEGEEVLVHSFGQVRQVTRDSKWAGGFKERNCYGWQAAYGQSHWMPKNIELPEEYHFYYKNDAKQKSHDRSTGASQ